MDIVIAPNEVLVTPCPPCDLEDPTLRDLADGMLEIMYKYHGIGLAAPQVGVLKRLFVMDLSWTDKKKEPTIFINPEIVELSGELETDGEGCLSLPGITVPVTRKSYAVVKFSDFDGNEWVIEGDGLLARCMQHEIDHLDGRLLFNSTAPENRIKALKDYEAALAAGARPGTMGV